MKTEKGGDEIEDDDSAKSEEEDDDENDDEGLDEDDDEEDEEEKQKRQEEVRKMDALEAKVKLTTQQLEEKMRCMVDADHKFDGLRVAIQEITQDAETTGAALEQARRRARLRNRGAVNDADDEADADGDEEMHDAQEEEDAVPKVVPSQMLQEKIAGHESHWEQQSLTQR